MQIFTKLARLFTSIRTTLVLGIGFIVALTLLMGVTAYISLQRIQEQIQTNITDANNVRNSSLEVENNFLIARQYESDFIDQVNRFGYEGADENFINLNNENLVLAQANLTEMQQIVSNSAIPELADLDDSMTELLFDLKEYEEAFQNSLESLNQRSRNDGLIAKLGI